MAKDTVIGIAWVVALIVVMAGVFAYESATFELDTYQVALETTQFQETGELEEGASMEFELAVPGQYLGEVFVVLDWSDDVGDPDAFELHVQADPQERQGGIDSASASGTPPLTFGQSFGSAEPQVEAASSGDALAQAYEEPEGGLWSGDRIYTITVTLQSAPGQRVGDIDVEADGSNAFTLSYGYRGYQAEVMQ